MKNDYPDDYKGLLTWHGKEIGYLPYKPSDDNPRDIKLKIHKEYQKKEN